MKLNIDRQNSSKGTIKTHLMSERFLLMIIKVLSSKIIFTKRYLLNIKRFLEAIDRTYYESDNNLIGLLIACDIIHESRFMNKDQPANTDLIISKIDLELREELESVKKDLIIPTILSVINTEPKEEALFVEKTIRNNIENFKILEEKDNLIEIVNDLESCSVNEFESKMNDFKNIITSFYNFFKSVKSSDIMETVLSTNDDSFYSKLKKTFDLIKSPNKSMKTGIKRLNEALGPLLGFVDSKFYIFYAKTNSFKSAFLQQIARMTSRYNWDNFNDIIESGKKPVITFMEFENDEDEDVERIFKTVTHTDIDSYNSIEDAYSRWKDAFYKNSTIEPISIETFHLPSKSKSVEDINEIIEELEENGKVTVMLIIDYIQLIKANKEDIYKEPRIQYQNIAENLLSLAKERHIPVITAHQLNRSGGAVLDNAKRQGVTNAVSLISNEYISESIGIENTVSYSAFIDIETHENKRYFIFKPNKSRGKRGAVIDSFVHPIIDGIIMEDDIDLPYSLSLNEIPIGTEISKDIINNTNVGRRGTINIKTNNEPKAKLGNEITIKSSNNNKIMNNFLRKFNDEWYLDIDDFGLETVTTNIGELNLTNLSNTNKIGNTQYTDWI